MKYLFAAALSLTGCDWLRPSCQVIKAAHAACLVVELPDGGRVQISGDDLLVAAKMRAPDAGP